MPRSRLQESLGHGVDDGEIPGSAARCRRLQLGHGEPGVRQPRNVAYIIRTQVFYRGVGTRKDRRAWTQHRIDHHLQRWSRAGDGDRVVPLDGDGRGCLRRLTPCVLDQTEHRHQQSTAQSSLVAKVSHAGTCAHIYHLFLLVYCMPAALCRGSTSGLQGGSPG
jgi:hypothetical protein